MSLDLEPIVASLRKTTSESAVRVLKNPGAAAQDSLLVDPDYLLPVCRMLRDELGFDFLSNLTGVDWLDPALAAKVATAGEATATSVDAAGNGFLEVVYHLYSTTRRIGPLVLRCRTANRTGDVAVPSVVSVYRSAEFQEREVYDLFGVVFAGHPDLRRILMWDGFADHPMRRDYVAPDDYEYEPTPHGAVLAKAKAHYPSSQQ